VQSFKSTDNELQHTWKLFFPEIHTQNELVALRHANNLILLEKKTTAAHCFRGYFNETHEHSILMHFIVDSISLEQFAAKAQELSVYVEKMETEAFNINKDCSTYSKWAIYDFDLYLNDASTVLIVHVDREPELCTIITIPPKGDDDSDATLVMLVDNIPVSIHGWDRHASSRPLFVFGTSALDITQFNSKEVSKIEAAIEKWKEAGDSSMS